VPFPPVERVVYGKNPLEQVICQVRFPPVLRIDATLPADFQEQIRGAFPDYAETAELKIEVPSALGDQVPPEVIRQVLQSSATKNYEFSSADGCWKVNLTRTFLALTATEYRRWEEFRERLEMPLGALLRCYEPEYFSRIGLRYVDAISRSRLGLSDVAWRELLSPALLGMLGSEDLSDSVETLEAVQQLRLADGKGSVRIAIRLTTAPDSDESVLVIDSDFFDASRSQITESRDKLDFLNARASRLIRWAITERLHEAMEPEPL